MNKEHLYRQKILSCAKEILDTDGEDAVTVNNIVKKCKISKSTFYNYFSSKEDLVNHLNSFSNIDGLFFSGTKDIIIYKAIEAISKFGFNGVDMDKIAELSGIRRTTMYHYFSSKEELWECCIRYAIDKEKRFIESNAQINKNPIEMMQRYIDYLCSLENKYSNIMIIVSRYHFLSNKKILQLLKEFIDMRVELFSSIIEHGKQKSYFRKDLNSVSASTIFTIFLSGLGFIEAKDFEKPKKMLFDILCKVFEDDSPEHI